MALTTDAELLDNMDSDSISSVGTSSSTDTDESLEPPCPFPQLFHPTMQAVPKLRQTHLGSSRVDGNLSVLDLYSPLRPLQTSPLLKLPNEILDMIARLATTSKPPSLLANCEVCPIYGQIEVKKLGGVCYQLWQITRPLSYQEIIITMVPKPKSSVVYFKSFQLLRAQAAKGFCRILELSAVTVAPSTQPPDEKCKWTKGDKRMTLELLEVLRSITCVRLSYDVNLRWHGQAVAMLLSHIPCLRHLKDNSEEPAMAQLKRLFQTPKHLQAIDVSQKSMEFIRQLTLPSQEWLTDLRIRIDYANTFSWSGILSPWLPNLQILRLRDDDIMGLGPANIVSRMFGPVTHTLVVDCFDLCPLPLPWSTLASELLEPRRQLLIEAKKKPAFRNFIVDRPYGMYLWEYEGVLDLDLYGLNQQLQCWAHPPDDPPLRLGDFERCENPFAALEQLKKEVEGTNVTCEIDLPQVDEDRWQEMLSGAIGEVTDFRDEWLLPETHEAWWHSDSDMSM
ncbi:hypothetical protein BT63DRAFT_454655 [Microthyrium microscopicum]|uniref:Uncharacterized protein n=1 Tax=Microthyrium microscopicum TaxID=703497 RepID=A0A6A6UFP5_9PEZI|nr:hypothetical protein BT63DRAFT_454655 [Microthyrium microscopicum]